MKLKKAHVVEYIALVNLQFSNAYNFTTDRERELLVNLWYEGLKFYPKELCDVAVKNALFKAEFVPKIATVLKEVETLYSAQQASDGQLWSELVSACAQIRDDVPYSSDRYDTVIHEDTGLTTAGEMRKTIAKIYDGLDPKLKEYCGSMRGFMDLSQTDEEDLKYEKGRFLKQLPIITERLRTKQQTPPELVDILKSIGCGEDKKLLGDKT